MATKKTQKRFKTTKNIVQNMFFTSLVASDVNTFIKF